MRLDSKLHLDCGMKSRTYGANMIKKGAVKVDGKIITKPDFEVF
jgi:RNA-binding protein YlmH